MHFPHTFPFVSVTNALYPISLHVNKGNPIETAEFQVVAKGVCAWIHTKTMEDNLFRALKRSTLSSLQMLILFISHVNFNPSGPERAHNNATPLREQAFIMLEREDISSGFLILAHTKIFGRKVYLF
jgi:hypothetical protein